MRLREFFNSELVSLPRGGFNEAEETFDEFLEKLLDRYLQHLQSIDDPEFPEVRSALSNLTATSRTLAASVVRALRTSLDGRVHLAYQEISKELSKIDWTPFRSELAESHTSFNLSDPFPVKTISYQGHCTELKKTFALTEPISWEALTAVNFGTRSIITNKDSNAFAPIKLNRDLDLQYSQTDFFQIEMKLEEIEARPNCSRTIDG